MSLSPRFPQPFLDALGTLSWRTVLALTSVDKRESPMRCYWINDKSAVIELAIEDQLDLTAFVARFPRCQRRTTQRVHGEYFSIRLWYRSI
jgi:hypothetical protein